MHLHLSLFSVPPSVEDGSTIVTLRSFISQLKKVEKNRKFNFLPIDDPWSDRSYLATDYQVVRDQHTACINETAKYLNDLHNIDLSVKFWKILLDSSILSILMNMQ